MILAPASSECLSDILLKDCFVPFFHSNFFKVVELVVLKIIWLCIWPLSMCVAMINWWFPPVNSKTVFLPISWICSGVKLSSGENDWIKWCARTRSGFFKSDNRSFPFNESADIFVKIKSSYTVSLSDESVKSYPETNLLKTSSPCTS